MQSKKPEKKGPAAKGRGQGRPRFRRGDGPRGGAERPASRAASGAAPAREGTLTRALALEAILESDGGKNLFIDEALEPRLASERLSARDRHLLQEISYGAVRHRNTLDLLLNQYVKFPMKRQDPPVRWGLRLGAYQVVYLSRIPTHAAIDGTLEALKGLPGVAARDIGFANAVLRRLASTIVKKSEEPLAGEHDPTAIPIRSGFCHFDHPFLPLHSTDPIEHLSLKHSHPRWMIERWVERFGEAEAVRLLEAHNRIPQVYARVTKRAPGVEAVIEALAASAASAAPASAPDHPESTGNGEGAAAATRLDDAGPPQIERLVGSDTLILRRLGDPSRLAPLRDGWIQIQDPTATAIGEALEPEPGARVLDLCAAPGGKAAQILERLGPNGSLLACDIDEAKLQRLRENLERAAGGDPAKHFETRLVPAEPEGLDLGEKFTHILLDAPCSNSGVLGRRPEARWRLHQADLPAIAERQRKLLDAALRHLGTGGRLVYATCSIEPEENEELIQNALSEHHGLKKIAERLFLPHQDPGDGGYYAVLQS